MDRPAPLILLIEDEPQMRRFLRTALTAHDYRLVEAETAKEGLAQATARNPDVVLLDLGLPDRDGLEVTRELRGWSATPIIVLSARGREQDKVAALDIGADDYLTKPFGVDELLARIRVALRHAAMPAGRGARSRVRGGRSAGRPDRPPRVAGRRGDPPDADRVQAARDPGSPRGQSADPPAAAARRLGHELREPVPLRPRLPGAAPAEDRGRPGASTAPVTEPGVGYRLKDE